MKYILYAIGTVVLAFFLAIVFGSLLLANMSPEQRKRFEEHRDSRIALEATAPRDPTLEAVLAQDKVKELLRNPDTAKWKRASLVEKPSGERFFCAVVLAENGFGGFQRADLVVTPEGLVLQTEEAWQSHCTGQKVIATLRG